MKYWLLIALFTSNGQYAGKVIQGPFPDKVACEQVQRVTRAVAGDPAVRSRCYTDDHMKGRSIDPGPPLFDAL